MKVIYIGPSIIDRGLQQYQVFNGLPKSVASEPKLQRLFASVKDLSRARAALSVQGSVEWSAYRAAVAAYLNA